MQDSDTNTHEKADSETVANLYARGVEEGRVPAGRWIYAAARRYLADLDRTDIAMDWALADRIRAHFAALPLTGEASGRRFELNPWQVWVLANLYCWRRADGRRRTDTGILQVARGNGKTTLMAGLGLFDLFDGAGRRVHIVANNERQATICLDTARTMARQLKPDGVDILWDRVEDKTRDSVMTAVPAKESSLDGLTPSLWIADEAAEFKGRHIEKFTSTLGKRRDMLGVVISTPGSNPDNWYAEQVKLAQAVLSGDTEDDGLFAALYGADQTDSADDEECWVKASPGISYGQPDMESVRRQYARLKRSAAGRAQFNRYYLARADENRGGWLDMNAWPGGADIDWDSLRGRPAWLGLDLSKSLDLTALVLAVPLDDGRVAIRGHYFWPSENVAQRELDYRMPIRTWAQEGRLTLTPGAEVNYDAVRARLVEIRDTYEIRAVGYDAWGSPYLVQSIQQQDQIPMTSYNMGISTFGPGCQLLQNLWAGGKLVIGDDPIMRRSCADALAQVDRNGNIRPVKSRPATVLDPLVAMIIAVHCWGGAKPSVYETELNSGLNLI